MSISAPINKAARIRLLHREHKLQPRDIRDLTGYSMSEIRAALQHSEAHDTPKSRLATARGSLTTAEVAEKVRIPHASARLVTG